MNGFKTIITNHDKLVAKTPLKGTGADDHNGNNMYDRNDDNSESKSNVVMIIEDAWMDGSSSGSRMVTKLMTTPTNTTNTTTKRRLLVLSSDSCHRRTTTTTTTTSRYQHHMMESPTATTTITTTMSPPQSQALETCNSSITTDSQNSSGCSSIGIGYSSSWNNGTFTNFRRQRIVRQKRRPKSIFAHGHCCPTGIVSFLHRRQQQQHHHHQQQQQYYSSYHYPYNCRLNDIILIVCTFCLCSFLAATSIFVRSGRLFPTESINNDEQRGLRILNNTSISNTNQLLQQALQHPLRTETDTISNNNDNRDEHGSDSTKRDNKIPNEVLNKWATTNLKLASTKGQVANTARTTTDKSADDGWSIQNEYGLVHVIQTRFMQYQPSLLSLGQARLKLFQSVTIPSIAHQTNHNFIWIIRTDPKLHSSILNPLLETLRTTFPSSNISNNTNKKKEDSIGATSSNNPSVILVASNDNPEGFRDLECVHDITNKTVLFGDRDMVHRYHIAAQTHTVLETRLDADDAIATFYIDTVQQSAFDNLKTGWMVWCAENHMEWQYTSPWNFTKPTGAILGLKAIGCITPGLTWGYTTQSNRSALPVSKHNKIATTVPLCHQKKYNKKKLRNSNFDPAVIKNGTGTCLVKLGNDVLPAALRARTPTSAGMDHVLLYPYTVKSFTIDTLKNSKWKSIQNEMWESLPALFGIDSEDLFTTRSFIQGHLSDIATDAYNGQCTKGHSCKQSAKEILIKIMNGTGSLTTS